jgi:hypothetical protein
MHNILLKVGRISTLPLCTLIEFVKTFFDPIFEPDIMMGPTAIDFAVEFFTRHSSSFDGLLSIFQVCYRFLPLTNQNQHDQL